MCILFQDPFIANASARSPQLQEKISNAIELLEAQRAADAGNDGTRQMMAIKHEDEHEDEHVTMVGYVLIWKYSQSHTYSLMIFLIMCS